MRQAAHQLRNGLLVALRLAGALVLVCLATAMLMGWLMALGDLRGAAAVGGALLTAAVFLVLDLIAMLALAAGAMVRHLGQEISRGEAV